MILKEMILKKRKRKPDKGETYIETLVSLLVLIFTISAVSLTLSSSSKSINSYIDDNNMLDMCDYVSVSGDKSISDTAADHPDSVTVKVISITPAEGDAPISVSVPVTSSIASGVYVYTGTVTNSDGTSESVTGSIHYFDLLIN